MGEEQPAWPEPGSAFPNPALWLKHRPRRTGVKARLQGSAFDASPLAPIDSPPQDLAVRPAELSQSKGQEVGPLLSGFDEGELKIEADGEDEPREASAAADVEPAPLDAELPCEGDELQTLDHMRVEVCICEAPGEVRSASVELQKIF